MVDVNKEVDKFVVAGNELVDKVKEIVKEGNASRIRVIHEGRPVIDIPLTVGVGVGVVTVLIAPVLAALGALAALVTKVEVEVERPKK
jgi:hypothetical protein